MQIHSRVDQSPSIEYTARINETDAYVYNHPGFAGGTMSWIFFDLDGPADVTIRPHRHVDSARVLPRRAGIATRVTDGEIHLTLREPGNFLVEFDGLLELPFLIFARPPALPAAEPRDPSPGAGRTLHFGPGTHRPGCIRLESGDTLDLAPGAEVFGCIRADDAENIRITGRGILNQSHLPFGGRDEERHPLEFIRCRNVRIEGLIVLDGCTWNLVFRDCDDVEVRDVSILSERPYSTDGINPCDSRAVRIERCFVRSKDDCISIKGLQRDVPPELMKPIHDIAVTDCLFWSDNNNGLVVGTETWASEIRDIRFERTDFVRVSGTCGDWAAAFAIQALHDTRITNIVFSDIDVEWCSGNPFSILYLDSVYGIPGERRDSGATIEKILFRDIRFHQGAHRHSLIQGHDALRTIHNVVFESIIVRGNPVTCLADLRIAPDAHATDVRVISA